LDWNLNFVNQKGNRENRNEIEKEKHELEKITKKREDRGPGPLAHSASPSSHYAAQPASPNSTRFFFIFLFLLP
jgi:hypothetical protein